MTSTPTTISSESQSFRVERSFIYKWKMKDFCRLSLTVEEVLPSTKFEFDFGTGLKFIGELSIDFFGMECTFTLKSPTHQCWNVCGMLWIGDHRPQYQVIHSLDQVCNTIKMNLTTNLNTYSWSSTIMCEIVFVDYKKITTPILSEANDYEFALDFIELLKSKRHSDVTLEVDGFEIPAHKCILASRSKVFAAMFEHDMKENKSNKVTIHNVSIDVFTEVLRYIYTDQANLSDIAEDLLAISDMYDLQNLKSMCEIELANELSTENAAETLVMAHLYKTTELHQHAVNFIKCNVPGVARTDGWQIIMNNYSFLLKEIFL